MGIYSLMSEEYSLLFPPSLERKDYLLRHLEQFSQPTVLDIGCADGSLLFQIENACSSLAGIDSDPAMIEKAQAAVTEKQKKKMTFETADMIHYLEDARPRNYGLVTCMGNTLVYLSGINELQHFLRVLKPQLSIEGKIIIQVLNYDRPQCAPGFQFPPLTGNRLSLYRSYQSGNGPFYRFKTRIVDSLSGRELCDIHRHYPFRTEEIETTAIACGYSRVASFGDYQGAAPQTEDLFRLVEISN